MRTEDLCNYSPLVDDTSEVNEGSIAPMLTTNSSAYIYIHMYMYNESTNAELVDKLLYCSYMFLTLLCHLQ